LQVDLSGHAKTLNENQHAPLTHGVFVAASKGNVDPLHNNIEGFSHAPLTLHNSDIHHGEVNALVCFVRRMAKC
jgi:hypothetical protein